jgi:tetratricopeptide (TPR) repeat protein
VQAQLVLERALAIRERALGPDNPYVGSSLSSLADVRRKQGRFPEALALFARAQAIATKAYGAAHFKVAPSLDGIGEVLAAEGDAAGALVSYQRSFDVRRQTLGADHPLTLYSMGRVARALALLGRCGEARPLIAVAIAGLEKSEGVAHPDVGEALVVAAECDLAAGQPAAALERLERAIAIAEKAKATPVVRGAARWPLVRALWSLGRRDAARAEARRADEELGADADGAQARVAVRAWLTARR